MTSPIAETTPLVKGRAAVPVGFRGVCVHMIGIGGCGMRGAAAVLTQGGAIVSGSDRHSFSGIGSLVNRGVTVTIGHAASNLPAEVNLVVASAAVPELNPELARARAAGCRVIKYAELVGELMAARTGIAIAGTHGKSTTTALCTHLLRTAGLDPSFVVGAECPQLGGGSGVGEGPHFIAEACEYDRSFLSLRPAMAAILNVEADHLDCYRDLGEIVEAFHAFARSVPPEGLVVIKDDDPCAALACRGVSARVETFGFSEEATWRAMEMRVDGGRYSFDVAFEDRRILRGSMAIAGRHNVGNALAATALAFHAGAGRECIAEALASFQGVDRRMSLRGEAGGVVVVDDYAHHPTEIQVTLAALRERYAPRKMWVVFQPHQHSRTRIFLEEFAGSFRDADEVVVPDIYGSRDTELEISKTSSMHLTDRMRANGVAVWHIPAASEVAGCLAERVAPGDLVVTMGAGDVWKVADDLVARLGGRN